MLLLSKQIEMRCSDAVVVVPSRTSVVFVYVGGGVVGRGKPQVLLVDQAKQGVSEGVTGTKSRGCRGL